MKTNHVRGLCVILLAVAVVGCATVPKESVELSYQIGVDLGSLAASYDRLVAQHFASLRAVRLDYLEKEWTPRYVKHWIEDGRLVDIATGKLVWDDERQDFAAAPAHGAEAALVASVTDWAAAAVADIEDKRAALVTPLVEQETQLRAEVAEAFRRLGAANAQITAHLSSLHHLQEVQDDALGALKLKDLVHTLTARLIGASNTAAEGLQAIRKADGLVDTASERIDTLRKKSTGGK